MRYRKNDISREATRLVLLIKLSLQRELAPGKLKLIRPVAYIYSVARFFARLPDKHGARRRDVFIRGRSARRGNIFALRQLGRNYLASAGSSVHASN